MAKNFYLILGISRTATEDDIRAAYRRLAKEYHPDHYSGTLGTFLDIQEAYEVLGDPHKRMAYDRQHKTREPLAQGGYSKYVDEPYSGPEPLIPEERPVRLDDISMVRSFQTFTPTFDEIYDWLWSNFRNMRQPKSREIQSLTLEVPVTPEQGRRGGQARILVPAQAQCPVCRGHGAVGYYECPRCAGEGCMLGEYPVNVSFPASLRTDHTVLLSLDRFGIHNTYLSVVFRITS